MLKTLKQTTLRSLKTAGVSRIVEKSRWRRERLLILAYHGISIADEHEFNHSLFMSAEVLRSRLQQLREARCAVLPLDEAVQRLYANDLPDRAVVLTFDDGLADFYLRVYPLIREFDLPATCYLTTFYCEFNRPVFDPMVSYLLWKGRKQSLDFKPLVDRDLKLSLRSPEAQDVARVAILEHAKSAKLSAEDKDELLTKLAQALRVDYESLLAQRIIQNVTAGEVTEMAASGIDIQLHTHRHRTPKDQRLFIREIDDNRQRIEQMTGKRATHFCYPSGVYDRAFLPWLEQSGVMSATTCEVGFASANSHRLLLPRVLDNHALSPIEFESWLTGVSAVLPRRHVPAHKILG
jgi:peptidoglycan/xylan/chitin deacetylase (PgdA/CDA1 family)